LGRLTMFRRDPVAFHNADGMIAPEGPFLWTNGNYWERQVGVRVRLDHHALVHYGGRKILWTAGEHLAAKKSCRTPIVHDGLFDAGDKFARARLLDISDRQSRCFP